MIIYLYKIHFIISIIIYIFLNLFLARNALNTLEIALDTLPSKQSLLNTESIKGKKCEYVNTYIYLLKC